MDQQPDCWQLDVEFHRVQEFLFSVPRLKDMVGANVLLGDLIRRRIPRLLDANVDALTVDRATMVGIFAPARQPNDPLSSDAAEGTPTAQDDPASLLALGIWARDGGHAVLALKSKDAAERLQRQIATLIREHCPGLDASFRINQQPAVATDLATDARVLIDLPVFALCDDTGNEPATETITIAKDKPSHVSASVAARRKAADRGRSSGWDVVTAIDSHLPEQFRSDRYEDLQAIAAPSGYLGVIHIDGNGVGVRAKASADAYLASGPDLPTDWPSALRGQIAFERFFHSMRGATRGALVDALGALAHERPQAHARVLMIGGDDLLVVSDAASALPFVQHYVQALAARPLVDGRALTIGAGVAIGRQSLPFFRQHELAEALARNAKRIARSGKPGERSVVDWMVSTSSWARHPDEHRAQHDVVRYGRDGAGAQAQETLLLNARPYPILASDTSSGSLSSLQALLSAAGAVNAIAERNADGAERLTVARSQLKWLQRELGKGRRYAERAFRELPGGRDGLRQLIGELAGIDAAGAGLWCELNNARGTWRTHLADFIEVLEIGHLGRRRPAPGKAAQVRPRKESA